MLRRKNVLVGKNLKIYGRVHIHGKKNCICIGNDCIITSNPDKNPTAGGSCTHLVSEGKLIIGNNVGISMANITARKSIIIEDNVLIGAGAKIWDTDFHPLKYYDRINKQDEVCLPIIIREGAFIGACSIILKGVTIGKHSIVGAGSVVTKDIPDGEVWAGNPARFIREVEK